MTRIVEGGTFSIVVRCGETKFSASGQPTLGTGGTAARPGAKGLLPPCAVWCHRETYALYRPSDDS